MTSPGRSGRLRWVSRGLPWALFALIVGLAFLPLAAPRGPSGGWVNDSLLFSLTQMLMLITLASNWNFVSRVMGYVAFGHAAFFGLGAYSTAILMTKAGWPFLPTFAVVALTAALAALAIGRATMHLKGPYFSIAMLGTFAALREIVRVARPLTGGGPGMSLRPYLNRPLFYYLAFTGALPPGSVARRRVTKAISRLAVWTKTWHSWRSPLPISMTRSTPPIAQNTPATLQASSAPL